MDSNYEYLNEEEYQKNQKRISKFAIVLLVIGLIIGGALITLGIINIKKSFSNEKELELTSQLEKEKNILENKWKELVDKGIKFSNFAEYTDGEEYDLKIITRALDPSFDYCNSNEYKKNNLTSKYCNLVEQINYGINRNKVFSCIISILLIMFGFFIITETFIKSGVIYLFSKKRKIMAFTTQQSMPIMKEKMEKMAPSVGKVAENIAKGIKKGLEDDKNK